MRRLVVLASMAVLVAGCGGGSSTPTTPVVVVSPTPTPQPTPPPGPTQADYAAACGNPLPPLDKAYGYKIKLQFEPEPGKKIINASPQVADQAYCHAIGLIANVCNTRDENDPTRVPCDQYLSGFSDEDVAGPNWYYINPATGEQKECFHSNNPKDIEECNVNSNNQYLLNIKTFGTFKACSGRGSTGTCGECTITEEDFNKQHRNPAGVCQ